MTVMNAWPEDTPDGLYEHAVAEIADNLGMYRRHRIVFLADGGVPLHVIADRLSLPIRVIERVLEEDLDNP
jgi:hypothetical protein